MISVDSPLKKLSARTDRKQAMIFDGIRHSAQIANLAYLRLRETLTVLALNELSRDEFDAHITAAFLDAWAFVDSVDRFKSLWQLTKSKNSKDKELELELQSIRDLRNVTDHLAQRIDYVVSNRNAALGSLSWITITNADSCEGLVCAIVPGTLRNNKLEIQYPKEESFEIPTGRIFLDAGEYSACLCDVLVHIESRIRKLEKVVLEGNMEHPEGEEYAASDSLFKAVVKFNID
tara:strand:- start:1218 stop:1919 length:702 start_codon:yes stop_codon:yes gene_type:complete